MEPIVYKIHELRCKFFEKLENEHGSTKAYFHPIDLARVSNSDHWLKRFLIHHEMEMKDALAMLWETCEWRKENKVHDINENTLNREHLEEGSIFLRNRDLEGKSLLVITCKKHVKGQTDFEELKRLVIYWFERAERKDKGEQITLFFDMSDISFNNIDMEYTQYLFNLFKCYYPDFLNYIIIFDLPFLLKAAFKVTRGWLPKNAVQKIEFVGRYNINKFVDTDQALISWGGLDDYTYKFVPEMLETPATVRLDDYKKKVHFADGSPLVEVAPSFTDFDSEHPSPSASKLRVIPSESVLFSQDGTELTGSVSLMNTNERNVTYKIKTTSPEKFRVRPSCGVLHPNNSTTISVVLQPGHPPAAILRDKFLVMSFILDDNLTSPTELAELWKTADSKKVDQHRLRCVVSGQSTSTSQNGAVCGSFTNNSKGDTDQKLNQLLLGLNHLTHRIDQMEADIRMSTRLQMLSSLFLLVMIGALLSFIQRIPEASDTTASGSEFIPSSIDHQDL